jgi:hypothetical protein
MDLFLQKKIRPIVVFLVCLFASFGMKTLGSVSGTPDEARLFRDVAHHLTQQGFVPTGGATDDLPLAFEHKGCRLLVGNGDLRANNTLDTDRLEAAPATVSIGYRGKWKPTLPPARAEIERQIQNHLYAIGIRYPRAAVLIVGRTANCPTSEGLLEGFQIWATG